MNLVYRHPNGAGIWQGDAPASPRVPVLDAAGIKVVVFAAREHQPKLPDRFDVIRARLRDDMFLHGEMLRRTIKCADEVSDLLVKYILDGSSVVTSCWAGYNRSGLISGLTMLRLGVSPAQAIRQIRYARGIFAMSNPLFVDIVYKSERRLAAAN